MNRTSFMRRVVVMLVLLTFTTQPFAFTHAQVTQSSSTKLAGDKYIVHVLNRLGYGARPGDVKRVRAMGIERYIETQLNPSSLNDATLEAKLQNFPALKLTNGELLAQYPAPGRLARQMQRQGTLPDDLKEIREQRTNGGAAKANNSAMKANGDAMSANGEMMSGEANNQSNADRAAYRQAIARYYRENNLELPQRVMQDLQASRIMRAVYSERQLQETMVDFWTNHFNVFAGKGVDRWYLVSYDRDVIRPNALGNFRDLLEATAKSPAMLFYLDNFQSVSPNAPNNGRAGLRRMNRNGGMMGGNLRNNRRNNRRNPLDIFNTPTTNDEMRRTQAGDDSPQAMNRPNAVAQNKRPKRGINENYARELMELHTLGVDGGYTQKDIVEVARAFTGWTIFDPRGYMANTNKGNERLANLTENFQLKTGEFFFNPRTHDKDDKTVLGQKITAGGIDDGEKVLDILATHPSTAKFIATKLARKFVTDEPTPQLVARISAAFTRSKGDIKETLRAVFTAPEFTAEANFRQKIKTPFELAASAMRALDVQTDARPGVHQTIARMGEPLYGYQAPTGYADTAETWVNTGALLERLNFAVALAANRLPGTRFDLKRFVSPQSMRISQESKEALATELVNKLLNGMVSDATKRTLMKQVSDPAITPNGTPNLIARNETDGAMTAATDNATGEMMGNNERRAMRREARDNRAARENKVAPEEQEARRIIGLIIGLPEFQRQ
ncbi:MAG: DUF1800 domain-containing protein [Pyrinomonadaceae bacterium MAG19_C2-C3]|nr:DUF1800 domain-containing protein [Pyrinomonadaceae bacterium MAG19_C2-C3]